MMKINNKVSKRGGRLLALLLVFSSLIIVVLIMMTSEREPRLQIVANETGEVLFNYEVSPGTQFYHEYIHSVMKTPIREIFMIDKDYIIVPKETWTKSFGAGIPYAENEQMEMIEGYFIVPSSSREIDSIRLMPSNMYEHTFQYEDEEIIVLSELPEDVRKLTIEVTGG
ncbi:DUF1850 domain-containing protein [Geomicrobium sediminis]|uniref:DUF1850 domain-containing protein n=1 Tax=Geomicrobium sediminis TaxID=1347788 RepID=A0ABS2PGQ6_9BACL|nr:DUF1850 domain-containing protein [Geomicrobium sediminis]MBM7634131.1 hypothetical protein [Geomicrobium sediminis]